MKRLSKIFLLFITIFSILILAGGNDVFAFANQYIAWRKDVDGDGKPDLLFRRYSTATQEQLEKYYNEKSSEYIVSEDGTYYLAYDYKGMRLPSKWVHPQTAGIMKPSTKEFVTIGYSFHTEQEGEYGLGIEGNTTAAMIAYEEDGTVTPITNSISNIGKYFNSLDSIILKPTIWDDEDYADLSKVNKEEEYKEVMPSLLYETYSNKGSITRTNFGTRWNISTLQPNNKLVYRYAIIGIQRTVSEVTDIEYVYVEDRVIYHDELLELRAAIDEAGIEQTEYMPTLYMSDIVISGALYDAGGYELSRTISQFFSQYKKHGYTTEFWPANVVGTAEEATQTAINLFDNAITLPKKSKRNVIVRHIGIGNNKKVTDQILTNSGYYLSTDTLSMKVKDDINGEYENVYANAYIEAGSGIWELYLQNIEVYQYMKKAANTYNDGHVAIGYNIATGSSLEDAAESLDIKLRWGSYKKMVGSNAIEVDGLIPESESEWVVIDFYYSKDPEIVYVNHLLVDLNNKVLPIERQMIRGNSTAYTGDGYTEPVSAITTSFDSLTGNEQIITMIQEKYYRQEGQSLMVRTSMHLLDERFSLLEIFSGIRYVGYEIYDNYVSSTSMVGKKVNPRKDWYKPFDVILGVILPANKTQVNFYYYNQDRNEATIPNKFISMEYEFHAEDEQGECENDIGKEILSLPSGQNVKTGITNLYRVMASAINLEYIPATQNRHKVDIQIKYTCGSQSITLNANDVKYQFSYFRVDELVVDALEQITLYDASSKWSSTSGSGIFSWRNDKYTKTFNEETSVKISALDKEIKNTYKDITNWKNYATVYVEDKEGNKSNSDPEKLKLSGNFLSKSLMDTVDANKDGKINQSDINFVDLNLEGLRLALVAAESVNQWAIDTYNDKLRLYNEAEAWYNSALAKSSVLQQLLEDAEEELSDARSSLNSANSQISSKRNTISTYNSYINRYKTQISTLESEISTLENTTIPNLEAEKAALEDEKAVLEAEKAVLEAEKAVLEAELETLQGELTTLNTELSELGKTTQDLIIKRAGLEVNLQDAEANKTSYCSDSKTSAQCTQAVKELKAAEKAIEDLEKEEAQNAQDISDKNNEIKAKETEITNKNKEISSKQTAINNKNSAIESKQTAIDNKQTAINNQNTSLQSKKDSVLSKQNSIADYESKIRKLNNEIYQIQTVTIPAIRRDISYWSSVLNARNNDFNLWAEGELALAAAAKGACWLEVQVREAAKELAEKLIAEAEENYKAYQSYSNTVYSNYDYCLAAYSKFETIKNKAGVFKTKSKVADVADYMGINITFRVSNMLVTLNGENLNNAGDLEDIETLALSDAMYQTTSLAPAKPTFRKQVYDGLGTKITINDYDWSSVSKYVKNGLRTLAGEVKYETKVLIAKDTLLYDSTTKSVVDNVYYSNYLDYPGSITNGKFQLDYDGLITKTSREVNIYTPIAASAKLQSNSTEIQDQSKTNVASNSNLQTIQLGVPFTVTFGNTLDSSDKVYGLTNMFKYTQGYYIKFDFDICNVKIKRNGSNVGWIDSNGTARTGTAKNQVIKAGTWIGVIYSGTRTTQLTAEVYSDVTDENINVIDENERHSYVVRSVAYNASSTLTTYYANKYDVLLDMMQYRSAVKDTVKNICTDKTTTGAENDVPSYFAEREYELVILNRLYDFRVTDIKDVAWKSVFRENKNSIINAHTGNLYYSGIKKWVITADDLTENVTRSSAEIGRNPTRILPIGAYKHTDQTYIKAPKLGYTFSYDMKVTGAYYDENGEPLKDKKVNITTKFYYISNDGNTFLEEYKYGTGGIYLFYKNADGKYVRIDEDGGDYELKFTPNDTYRYIEDTEKITLSNKVEALGNLRNLELKYNMATVNQSFNTSATANNGTIITYYGEYKLPNSTIAVKVDKYGKYDINKPLKNGYIGVIFNIEAVAGKYGSNEKITLSYSENSNGTNTSQWDYEGYLGFTKPGQQAKFSSASSIRLEEGNWNLNNTIYNKIKGTVILYDVDEKAATDFE